MSSNLALERMSTLKEKNKLNSNAINKKKIIMGWGFWNATATETACEHPLFLHGIDWNTSAFLGNVFCHSYVHCYISLAVIATTSGLS